MSQKRIKVREGDLIAVPLEDNLMGIGIILHISKRIRNGILMGFYSQFFSSLENIDPDKLGGAFIYVPNYTGKDLITKGDWFIIGYSKKLLDTAIISELASVYDIYYKDTIVRRVVDHEELRKYPVLAGEGGRYVENKLRKYFHQNGGSELLVA